MGVVRSLLIVISVHIGLHIRRSFDGVAERDGVRCEIVIQVCATAAATALRLVRAISSATRLLQVNGARNMQTARYGGGESRRRPWPKRAECEPGHLIKRPFMINFGVCTNTQYP